MAFQIKDFGSIVASMINHVRATTTLLTDFRIGSANRTMLESPAIEIEQLYQQFVLGLRDAIPAALYPPFGFDLLPAVAATTNLTFSVASPAAQAISIPAGTTAKAPDGTVQYLTQADGAIAAGAMQTVLFAAADTIGAVGNCPADTVTALVSPISGVSVNNDNAIVSGRDLETYAERAQRFLAFVLSLARSPAAAVGYGAATAQIVDDSGQIVEYVQAQTVDLPYERTDTAPLGYFDVYIWNGVDSASDDLVAAAQHIVDGYVDEEGNRVVGYVAGGCVATVRPTTEVYVTIHFTVWLVPGYALSDVATPINSAVGDYITGLDIGAGFVAAEAVALAMQVTGVYNVQMSATDIAPAIGVKLLAGAMSVGLGS